MPLTADRRKERALNGNSELCACSRDRPRLQVVSVPQRRLLWTAAQFAVCTVGLILALLDINMGGPNLEVFKFAMYVTLPMFVMWHYSNPEWYAKNVLPVSPA